MENKSIELFEAFKTSVQSEYKETLLNFESHSQNNKEIDKLNQSNDDILVSIQSAFKSKLNAFKKETNLSKKEAIANTFMILESSVIGLDTHKKTSQVFNTFKEYYNSKLYLSEPTFKDMKDALKALNFVPYKVINDAFKSDTQSELLEYVSEIKSLLGVMKELSESEKIEVITALKCSYIHIKEGKISTDKSNFADLKRDTLKATIKAITLSRLSGVTFKA